MIHIEHAAGWKSTPRCGAPFSNQDGVTVLVDQGKAWLGPEPTCEACIMLHFAVPENTRRWYQRLYPREEGVYK